MSKRRLTLLTISLAALAIGLYINGQYTAMLICAVITCLVGLYLASRINRDRQLVETARRERETATQTPQLPPQCSARSHGLFVPPPLDKQ